MAEVQFSLMLIFFVFLLSLSGLWEKSALPPGVVLFFLFLKIYLFYVFTIALFRHPRRGHQTPLEMVESHHVVGGN